MSQCSAQIRENFETLITSRATVKPYLKENYSHHFFLPATLGEEQFNRFSLNLTRKQKQGITDMFKFIKALNSGAHSLMYLFLNSEDQNANSNLQQDCLKVNMY